MALIVLHRDPNLGPAGFFVNHEGQIAVGRAARDDFQEAVVLQGFKPAEEPAPAGVEDFFDASKLRQIHGGGFLKRRRKTFGPEDFFFSQLHQFFQFCPVAGDQEIVGQHVAERRRERHGDAERNFFSANRSRMSRIGT
jgi:hypothetical protein